MSTAEPSPAAAPAPASPPVQAGSPLPAARHWRRNVRLTLCLLGLWATVTFGFGFFAGALDGHLFGWPFSFWFAAQGALLVYCAIVWGYAWAMERLDREAGQA